MATLDDLLRQAAGLDGYGIAGSLGQDRGLSSATEAEFDLRTMTPNMLRQKYGDGAAAQMMGSLQRGISDRNSDAATRDARTWGEAGYDTTTGLLAGAVGSIGGLVSLGTGLVNDRAGAAVAGAVQDGMQWAEGTQSDAVNAARRLQRSDSALDARDNTAQMVREQESGDSPLATELRRWGRDVVDTVGNSMDPVMFAQGTAEATGSLLAGGPIAKGLRAIGAPVSAMLRGGSATRGIGPMTQTGSRIAAAGDSAAWPLATAGLEAGGAYSGSVNEVMEMSFEDLAKNSPMYRELIAEGKTPTEARTEVANRTGLMAAAIQAPIAGVAGTLTRFAETPTRAPSLGTALGNVLLREPTEEAIQSTTGAVAQNYALKQYADTNRSLSEGVGEQTAQGALYGMSSAGVLQGPTAAAAARGSLQGIRAGAREALRDSAAARMQAAERKSEVGAPAIKDAAATIRATGAAGVENFKTAVNASETISDADKRQANDYVDQVISSLRVAPDDPDVAQVRPVYDSLNVGEDRVEAVSKAAEMVLRSTNEGDKLAYANLLRILREPLDRLASTDVVAKNELPTEQFQQLELYQGFLDKLKDFPQITRAMDQVAEILSQIEVTPVTAEQVSTPEGQAKIGATILAVENDPTKGNIASINAILDHASKGLINLSPGANAALKLSRSVLDMVNQVRIKEDASGKTHRDRVSENVLSGMDPNFGNQMSVRQHLNEIRAALKTGDMETATALLENFGEFAQHMSNKVAATNAHYDTFNQPGRPKHIPYQAYNPAKREWYNSEANQRAVHKGAFIEPTNQRAIDMAQNTDLESWTVGLAFNNIAEALPELGVQPIQIVGLNPALIGNSAEIAQRHRDIKAGVRSTTSNPATITTPVPAQPKVEAAPAPTPAAMPAPKQETPKAAEPANTPEPSKELEESQPRAELASEPKASKSKQILDKLVEDGKATIKEGVYYVTAANGTPYMGGTTPEGIVYVNLGKIRADGLEDYLSNSEQKQAVLKSIGVTTKQFASLFPKRDMATYVREVAAFVRDHELSHLKNEDRKSYPRTKEDKPDLMHPDAIAIETRATLDGLTDAQRKRLDAFLASRKALPPNEGQQESPEESPRVEAVREKLREIWTTDETEISRQVDTKAPQMTGPVSLNKGQTAGLEKITNWLDSSDVSFALTGAAGTGKTTLMSKVIEALHAKGLNPVLTSPTHRANTILQQKNPGVEVRTIHKLLKLKPNVDIRNFDARKVEFQPPSPYDQDIVSTDVVIVDESSMVVDDLTKMLKRAVNDAGAKILFLGDLAQLKPVDSNNNSSNKLASALSKSDQSHELTEVMRAGNTQLLDESVHLRNEGDFSNTTAMNDSAGVAFTRNRKVFLDKAIALYKSSAFKKNPLLLRVLAFKNDTVVALNKEIRGALYGKDAKPFQPGELLMGYNKYGDEILNGVDYIVESSSATKTRVAGVSIPTYSVKLTPAFGTSTKSFRVTIADPTIDSATKAELQKAIQALLDRAKQYGRREWAPFYQAIESVAWSYSLSQMGNPKQTLFKNTVDYGYAHTVHKSQGGTYTYSFVMGPDLASKDLDMTSRLAYVALTRASKGSYVLTDRAVRVDVGDQPSTTVQATPQQQEAEAAVVESMPENQQVTPVEAPITIAETAQEAIEAMGEVMGEQVPAEEQILPTGSTEAEPDIPEGRPTPMRRAVKTNLTEQYPGLINHVTNYFTQLFQTPKNPTGRMAGQDHPVQVLLNALSGGMDSIREFGATIRHPQRLTDDALQSFRDLFAYDPQAMASLRDFRKRGKLTKKSHSHLATVKGVSLLMQQRLVDAMQRPYKGHDSIGAAMIAGEPINRLRMYRGLNIAEISDNGNINYNNRLVELASLAGFQWVLTMGAVSPERTADDIQSITGIDESLQGDLGNLLNGSFTIEEISAGMTPIIKRYWNVRDPQNDSGMYADPSYLEGIPQALALEFVSSLVELGLVRADKIKWTNDDGTPQELSTYKIQVRDEGLVQYRNLIEELMMDKPVAHVYTGDERPGVPDTKLNTQGVENTSEERQVIAKANNTPYTLVTRNFDLFNNIGIDALKTMFGGVLHDGMNKNHAASVRGRHSGIEAGWNAMVEMKQYLASLAEEGKTSQDVPVYYQHNMSSVSRLHQLGGQTPQGNTLVRSVMLPTLADVDLSDARNMDLFKIAVAQALDIKVHRQNMVELTGNLNDRLAVLKPALDAVDAWVADPSISLDHALVSKTFSDNNIDLTPLALQALMEQARYNRASDSDRKNFNTSIFIEADGVTNGVAMAMLLFSVGQLTIDQLRSLRKAGINIGSEKTMDELFHADRIDNYGNAAAKSQQFRLDMRAQIAKQKDNKSVMATLDKIERVAARLLDGITLSEDGQGNPVLSFDRSVAKNPMTVTLYGSSVSGIANKLAGIAIDKLYELASQGEIAEDLAADLNFLMNNTFALDTESNRFYTTKRKEDRTIAFGDRKAMTLDRSQFNQLKQNFQIGLVGPLRQGIEAVLGSRIMETTEIMRTNYQLQSIFYSKMFADEVEAAVQSRAKNDPEFVRGGSLSRTDMNRIHEKLKNIAPWFDSGNQRMLINKFNYANTGNNYARSLDEKMRPKANEKVPINSGVASIAYMNISGGDAQTIQVAWNKDSEITGESLPVFDGVNMSIKNIDAGSLLMNQAVQEVGNRNLLLYAKRSADQFISDQRLLRKVLDDAYINEDKKFLQDLDFALGLPKDSYTEMGTDAYIESMLLRRDALSKRVIYNEAHHKTMQKFKVSYDQFAAVGRPFVTDGLDLSTMSDERIVEVFNEEYNKQVKELQPLFKAAPRNQTVEAVATVVATTGAVVLPASSLSRIEGMTAQQIKTLEAIAPGVGDFTVVMGNPTEIAKYNAENGLPVVEFLRDDGAVRNGMIDFGNRHIYVANTNPEVAVHELVHAATFEAVLAHYEGRNQSKEVADAVQRLETLMDQFLQMKPSRDFTSDQNAAMHNLRKEIDRALANPTRTEAMNKAQALNEFMAWSTTNTSLGNRLSKTKANKLSRIADAVMDLIRRILGIPGSDMLSNIVFNTAIVAHSGMPLHSMMAEVTLDHAFNGAPSNLIELRNHMEQKIAVHLNTLAEGPEIASVLSMWPPMVAATQVAQSFSNVFNLNDQQQSAFRMVVAVMATEMELESSSLGQMQNLFQHVLKNLTVDSFIPENSTDRDADRYYAAQKYDLITGKVGLQTDKQNRSSQLAAFLGLSLVSPEFAEVINTIALPKTEDIRDGSFDAALQYRADRMFDSLSEKLSGQAKSKNMAQATHALSERIFQFAQEDHAYLNAIDNGLDAADGFIVNQFERLATYASGVNTKIQESPTSNPVTRFAGNALQIATALLTDSGTNNAAETTISLMNGFKVFPTIGRLISDIIGRVDSTGDLYDKIKLLRSEIQRTRQLFRVHVPNELSKSFKLAPTAEQWEMMHQGLSKSDFSALVPMGLSSTQLLGSKKFRDAQISKLENEIRIADPRNYSVYEKKSKQLANYMVTGVAGPNLLANAEAIALLLNTRNRPARVTPELITQIDQLVSLYALNQQPKAVLDGLHGLFQAEPEGMRVITEFMAKNQEMDLKRVAGTNARYNYFKGYLHQNPQEGSSLRVVEMSRAMEMRRLGYTFVGDYKGSSVEGSKNARGYFYTAITGKAPVAQGIMQNIHRTAAGVDPHTGFSTSNTAGRIGNPVVVRRITGSIESDRGGAESLRPIFDEDGLVKAYERMLDPRMIQKGSPNNQLHELLGQSAGRQMEEAAALAANIETIKVIDRIHKNAIKGNPEKKKEFVNLMNTASLDPVIRDMVSLMSIDTREYIEDEMGGELWVQRDMLEDVTGYRNASVGDFFTGNTRWSPAVQTAVRDMAITFFGADAYRKLQRVESVIQGLAADARTLIVVKSGIVPLFNFVSNIYHLLAVGVPIQKIVKNMPRKLIELRSYNKSMSRLTDIEIALYTTKEDSPAWVRLNAEKTSINDAMSRLSIAPLIRAGEFSTIADVGDQGSEVGPAYGRIGDYIERQVDRIPDRGLRTFAKYAIVSRDTALYQGMQKSVQYGDFLAKAMLFDHLTQRHGKTTKQALAQISDEFVNYDRLPGRVRGTLERNGLLWFWNFKLRMVKVAASTLRNRPVHALLTSLLPAYPGTEMPIGDTIVSQAADGSLGYSIGPGMGFSAPTLSPWWNLVD